MKAKLQTALRANVDPFFFALVCAILVSISMTAKVLADDVFVAVGGATDDLMITADGQLVWQAE
jgi:hypothetical protein